MMPKDRNLVVVVDDDPGMLNSVQRLLQRHEYEPILFSSAEAFKNYPDVDKADCVILDINLKDGSGIELRHGLKDAGISVPVIYMTGNDDPVVRKAAVASACIAFLTKPFSTQSLIEPLNKAAAGHEALGGNGGPIPAGLGVTIAAVLLVASLLYLNYIDGPL